MHDRISPGFGTFTLVIACAMVASPSGWASEHDGYTEPLHTFDVASDESGTVAEVLVELGQRVAKGQPLVRLNNDVFEAQLKLAHQQMNADGRLDAAVAEQELASDRLDTIRSLRKTGHARQIEVDRAVKDFKVAEAHRKTIQEEIDARRLEYERLKTQIDRRLIRSPAEAVVTEIHREPGEFVAPNRPEVVKLVQLEQLVGNFALLADQAHTVKVGQQVPVEFYDLKRRVTGTVTFVAPVIDAESGTVLIKVLLENSDGSLRSGARCTAQLPD